MCAMFDSFRSPSASYTVTALEHHQKSLGAEPGPERTRRRSLVPKEGWIPARRRSAALGHDQSHWVQGSPQPTTVVITLCHNTKHEFLTPLDALTSYQANPAHPNSSFVSKKIALPVRSHRHTHPPNGRERGESAGDAKCQKNAISRFRTMLPFSSRAAAAGCD